LFSIYVLRLDKGICPAVAYGMNKERFADKHFIDKVFFEKTKTIDMFLSVFEIGFSKFINEMGEKWTPQTFTQVDIFALFNIYCLFLQNGIISKQNTSEFARLQNRIIHFLEFPLCKPRNTLTMLVARTMLNFILIYDQRGRVSLRYSSKDQLIKLIPIFSRCIQLISEDIEEFQDYNVNLLILASVFDMHKDMMKKTLSNEDFARLQKNILLFTSFKQSAFVPIKPDQSLPEQATPADILPEEVLDPVKDPLYPFITGEIVLSIQDSDLSEQPFNGYLEQIYSKEEPEEDYVTAYFEALDSRMSPSRIGSAQPK
jgi:hypothetical protein